MAPPPQTRRDMTPDTSEAGHRRVMLYRAGKPVRFLVHRLVLEAFDRLPRGSEQGCHIDGDPANNALWNLRWGTQESNWDDSKRHGTRRRHSKLVDQQADEVRRLFKSGVPAAEIGRTFEISDTQVRNIGRGFQWKPPHHVRWPLPSVWIGVSCEDQQHADERIPELLRVPAAVRFLSVEPQLGSIDLNVAAWGEGRPRQSVEIQARQLAAPGTPGWQAGFHPLRAIDWVIDGGESGLGARPFDLAWARSIRDQCADAGVPFFFKQAGAKAYDSARATVGGWQPGDTEPVTHLKLLNRKGADLAELPADLHIRQFPHPVQACA